MANSSYQGAGAVAIPFDWDFGAPSKAIDAGVVILSGKVIVYSQSDLDALFALWRAVSRRAAGDPTVGGTSYVDYWGPDPAGPLVMTQPLIAPPKDPPLLEPGGLGGGLNVPGTYEIAYAWVSSVYGTSEIGAAADVTIDGVTQTCINYTLPPLPDGIQSADIWLLGAPTGIAPVPAKMGNTAALIGGLCYPGAAGTPPLAGLATSWPAILSKFDKSQTLPGGVHFCNAEFTLMGGPTYQ